MSVGFWNERVPALLDEIIGMYRTAGRSLARLTDDELDANFVETVEAYITDPRTPARFCAVNNVAAEYVLRRRGAPFERLWPFQEGRVTINQRFRGVIVLPNNLIHMVEGLPMVVLAFGRFGTIPAAGIIFTISDEDPPNWNKLTGPLHGCPLSWRPISCSSRTSAGGRSGTSARPNSAGYSACRRIPSGTSSTLTMRGHVGRRGE